MDLLSRLFIFSPMKENKKFTTRTREQEVRAVAEPRISSKSAKSHEIHKNMRNSLEILPNTCRTTYLKVIFAVGAVYSL